MREEISSLLKRARLNKGLSLKEAEIATRVPIPYLQILEGEGNSRLLGEDMYLVPFLRTYSGFLGLDPAATVAQFVTAMQQDGVEEQLPLPKLCRMFSRTTVIVLLVLAGLAMLSLLWLSSEHG